MPGKDYMAEYRRNHKSYTERSARINRAKGRADRELRKRFYAEWLVLLQEEYKKEGIEDAEG